MKTGVQQANYKFNKTPVTTNLKSNVSYSSPKASPQAYKFQSNYQNLSKKLNYKNQSNYGQAKSLLKQSNRRIASSISMTDFFKENIQNKDIRESAYTKILNSAQKTQQLQILHNEHRIEVEKLLLEISRLHDVIYEMERSKKYEFQRLKEQYQQMTYLHLNNLKQSQITQLEILQVQLKKTKQILDQKITQNQQLQRTATKQRQMFKSQNETLRNSLKQILNKKNQQLYEIQEQNQQKLKDAVRNNSTTIEQMKQTCEKQIKKIQKQLEQKQQKLNKLQLDNNKNSLKNNQLEQTLERQRVQLEQRLQVYIQQSNHRYQLLSQHIQQVLKDQQHIQNDKQNFLKQIYQKQINNLMNIIKLKDNENMKLKTQLQSQRIQYKLLTKNTDEQNQYLKNLLKKIQQLNLQQIQKLKIKMAILHENDINQLVKLYQTKIQNLNQQLNNENKQTIRLRDYMHQQTHRWLQNKKNYQYNISKLNVQILRLRNGLGDMQKDMKQRYQNQRSALLLTSQNLIRGVQLKNTNSLFYQQQARKLRLTIQKLQHQYQQNQQQLKQQIKKLQQQIRKIIQLNKQNQLQNHKLQQQKLMLLQQKQNQIKRLNKITHDLIQQNKKDQQRKVVQLKINLQQLNKLLMQKNDKIKQLSSKIQKLQKQIQQLKIQNQQLYLQNQINHQQAKQQYQKIANSNIKSLKQFYQRKINQLELDKNQLKIKQSADQANITELIRRYQLLQDYVKKILKQSKKRTQLQERIINIGLDNNLVKNKAYLFGEKEQEII